MLRFTSLPTRSCRCRGGSPSSWTTTSSPPSATSPPTPSTPSGLRRTPALVQGHSPTRSRWKEHTLWLGEGGGWLGRLPYSAHLTLIFVQVKTQQGVPSQPSRLAAAEVGSTSIKLSWEQPDHAGENILSYELYWNDTYTATVWGITFPLTLGFFSSEFYKIVDFY